MKIFKNLPDRRTDQSTEWQSDRLLICSCITEINLKQFPFAYFFQDFKFRRALLRMFSFSKRHQTTRHRYWRLLWIWKFYKGELLSQKPFILWRSRATSICRLDEISLATSVSDQTNKETAFAAILVTEVWNNQISARLR